MAIVTTGVDPISIAVQIIQPGNVIVVATVLVAFGPLIRIVVVRIRQVRVVIGIAAVIGAAVPVAVIVVYNVATNVWRDIGDYRLLFHRGATRFGRCRGGGFRTWDGDDLTARYCF